MFHDSISYSPNSWTDGKLALEWMKNDFEPATQAKAEGRICILILDGHGLHYTLALLEYARANNIVILGYPPHCTHILQGLDVVCFTRMKNEFRIEIQAF